MTVNSIKTLKEDCFDIVNNAMHIETQSGNYNSCNCTRVLCFNMSFQWRHNGRDGVPNHEPHDCLLNRLFRRRSKKTPKLRVTGLCVGIHRWPVNSPHKGTATRKMFPFDNVIMARFGYKACFILMTSVMIQKRAAIVLNYEIQFLYQ